MKIISSYHKKLHCQVEGKSIGIEPNQIINVDDGIGKVLIGSPWIHEAIENVGIPAFTTCNVPPEIEKPSEKKIEKPVEKKERLVRKTEKLGGKKYEMPRENPIRQKSKVE